MALFNIDNDPYDEEEYLRDVPPTPEKKPKIKAFHAIIIALGVILLLALAGLFVFAPRYLANQRADRLEQAALINAANTATAIAAASSIDQELTVFATTEPGVIPTVVDNGTPSSGVETTVPGESNFTTEEMATISALQTQMVLEGTPSATGTELLGGSAATDEIPFPTESAGLVTPTEVPAEVVLTQDIEIESTDVSTQVVVETEDVNTVINEESTPAVLMTEEIEGDVDGEVTPIVIVTEALAVGSEGEMTPTTAPTELPDTGLADNLRLPLLTGLAVLLVVIIVFSRRLRLSSR